MRQFMKLFEFYVPQGLMDETAEIAFGRIDWSSSDGEMYRLDYARHADIEIEPEDHWQEPAWSRGETAAEGVDIDAPEFREWFKYEINEKTGDAQWGIEEGFREGNGVLRVYRVITAPRNWKPDPNRHPGVYWAWDYRKADAHWGSFDKDHIKWMLEADVTADMIDWPTTLAANAVMPEEAEIKIKDGVEVKIADVYPEDELRGRKKHKHR